MPANGAAADEGNHAMTRTTATLEPAAHPQASALPALQTVPRFEPLWRYADLRPMISARPGMDGAGCDAEDRERSAPRTAFEQLGIAPSAAHVNRGLRVWAID
jgi:hypothetical protein